jgi:hypothetical protein
MDITFEVVSKKIEERTSGPSSNNLDDFESKGIQGKKIPVWVKNNAKGWTDGHINDKLFISSIQYLIDNKVIESDFSGIATQSSNEIPQWVKNIAGYWVNDMITDENFISSIQYLVNNQIINP